MADRADNESLPLKGVVLCCTSLPQELRVEFGNYATEMGAIHNLDLTSEVTHLIVGDITTPKYRYTAKDRPDIVVLSIEWLRDVRKHWMEGDVVDLVALERLHRLPAFYGLKICVTGFQNAETRDSLESRIREQGAQYYGDLTKHVTHLIAASPQGEKYKFARQWGLQVVSIKWFDDSLDRGMALDETLYDPTMPAQEQGKGAFRRQNSLGKRTRSGNGETIMDDAHKRKLRRTASTRLHSQSQDLWNDISLQNAPPEQADGGQWEEDADRQRRFNTTKTAPKQDFPAQLAAGTKQDPLKPRGLFSSCCILLHGFNSAREARLREHLVPNGAVVVDTADDLKILAESGDHVEHYLLVPHAMSNTEPISLPDVPDDTLVVSEWWLERCIDHKSILAPSQDPLCRPLWNADRRIFEGMKLCTTGFSSLDFRQSVEALQIYGAEYCAQLDANVTVLVSGAEKLKQEKALYASKHGISVVSADWVWACLNTDQRQPFDGFLIALPKYTPLAFGQQASSSSLDQGASVMKRPSSGKGNGKDETAPKRLSSTKPAATPTLSMQASDPLDSFPSRRKTPFILEDEDDEDDDGGLNGMSAEAVEQDARTSASLSKDSESRRPSLLSPKSKQQQQQPLEERSPNASPRKTAEESKLEGVGLTETKTARSLGSLQVKLSKESNKARLPHELAADLASILQRATSRSAQSTCEENTIQRRKNRPLGRNLSGSIIGPAQREGSSSGRPLSENGKAANDHYDESYDYDQVPPGTQLGYETIEAAAYRMQMEKQQKAAKAKGATPSRAQTRQRRNKT